jgi:stage V sporulation protein SpoVS
MSDQPNPASDPAKKPDASERAQAVKAIAIANGMLSRQGLVVDALPCFVTRQFADNHDTTAMQLKLNARAI